MAKRERKNDGYLGKVEFWTEQLALAKEGGQTRYPIERCEESLAYFKGKREQYLAQKAQEDAPMMPRPDDAEQRALDACRAKFEGLDYHERIMLANKTLKDAVGAGISVNQTLAFLKDAGVMSDTELIHSVTF